MNQEKALVGAFSVIVQPVVEPMDRFTALGETVEQSSELWEELPGCGVRTDAAASCGHQHNSDRIHLKAAGHFQKNFNADIQPDIYF